MINLEPKCKNCIPPKRHINCHSTCEEYIKWKKELTKLNNKIKEKSYLDSLFYNK